MILERRVYTLLPGNVEAFWRTQVERGFDLVAPIMERLIGYFHTLSGPTDEIVHLWRYDDYADWQARLHGLYGVEGLDDYFPKVRVLMTRQVNATFVPAPIDDLAPLFGGGRDWLPGDAPVADAAANPELLVEERTLTLRPGGLPAYYDAWDTYGRAGHAPLRDRLIGAFESMIGVQHQIVTYWWFDDFADRRARHRACEDDPDWRAFTAAVRPDVVEQESKLLAPSPLPEMCPIVYPD